MITGYDLYGDLPLFPSFTQKPSEERLEREVERLMDRADVRFLAGKATQTQYDDGSRRSTTGQRRCAHDANCSI